MDPSPYAGSSSAGLALDVLARLPEAMPGCLVVWSLDGRVHEVNAHTTALLGRSREELLASPVSSFWPAATELTWGLGPEIQRAECAWCTASGAEIAVLVSTTRASDTGPASTLKVSVGVDLTERKELEVELINARKLESIGQLASGIAHELNTPIQFVYDNTFFLVEAFDDLTACIGAYREALAGAAPGAVPAPLLDAVRAAEERADLDFLFADVPDALARVREGAERVAAIVRAMKAFAHPRPARAMVDLNAELELTLIIARNEYKYVADVELLRGDIPLVHCDAGHLNQVFLNLIVNAAHAIEDAGGARGRITVETRVDGDGVVVAFTDTGGGIPAAIRDRVFDPFFTTKSVGRGSGQGLALARRVVVEQHGGAIDFDTEDGHGTTFRVRLPAGGDGQDVRF